MDKRKIAKIAANQIVTTAVGVVAKKACIQVAPNTVADHPKITDIVCTVTGYAVTDHFEKPIHNLVDSIIDKIEARRTKKTT